jgi:hypothetical protein
MKSYGKMIRQTTQRPKVLRYSRGMDEVAAADGRFSAALEI